MDSSLVLGVLFFLVFLSGYFLGRLQRMGAGFSSGEDNASLGSKLFGNRGKGDKKVKAVSIDETKFVTTIKTNDFKKGFEKLGDEKIIDDDITSSIAKLSNLKNKKK